MRLSRFGVVGGALAAVALVGGIHWAGQPEAQASPIAMPLSFVENRGQTDGRVAYYVQSPRQSLYFTPGGYTMRLSGPQAAGSAHVVKVEFVGALAQAPIPLERAAGVVSYFRGPAAEWRTGIAAHSRIGYAQAWPGIDLAYDARGHAIESIYTVAPHADPGRIRLRYSGQEDLRVAASGELVYATPAGQVKESAPIAWQDIDGQRVPVAARFALVDAETVGFELAAYDAGHAVVIDPSIVYAGFIGGSDEDIANAVAVDGDGNAYVTGSTKSTQTTFPETAGPDLSANGSTDAFVAKISADGTTLLYAGYIGGSGADQGYGIAVDGSGNAYVTGATQSSASSFPVSGGPDLTFNGSTDAFVAKVNAAGTALSYCGYIGGNSLDRGQAIAVDGSGNAYVAGFSMSNEGTFPKTGGPDLTYNDDATIAWGIGDAFVAKVSASGSALTYAGYIGGAGYDEATGIAVDSSGRAYVVGTTGSSTTLKFPATVGPDLGYNGAENTPADGNGNNTDVFVARVAADGSALEYAGYVGGSAKDSGYAIAVDGSGSAFVAGQTASKQTDGFPVAVGPDLTYNDSAYGFYDAFVAKVKADGSALDYAGYIGGNDSERATAIALDASGNVYVTGHTFSTQATFPVTGGLDATHNGGYVDAFAARVKADGTGLDYCGYVGGFSGEQGHGIAVDGSGNAYIAGYTMSDQTTFPDGDPDANDDLGGGATFGATHAGGGSDAFLVKLDATIAPPADTTPDAFSFTDQTGVVRGSVVTSASITVSGIDAAAPISVSGGEYSIGCTGSFTASASTIDNGQTVCVRHTASPDFNTAVNTVLTIGGVSDTFTSTTQAASAAPVAPAASPPGGGGGFPLLTLLMLSVAGAYRRICRRKAAR